MSEYKVFTVNPGSTSTKITLFKGEKKLYSANVSHDAEVLAQYKTLEEQLAYRKETIENLLKENHVDLNHLDACVGRGGGLLAMDGGTYEIDALVLEHSIHAANGVVHPALVQWQQYCMVRLMISFLVVGWSIMKIWLSRLKMCASG